MDKTAGKGSNRWAWLPVAMPGVARLMAAKRLEVGAAHVAECWSRGVLKGEPGWFFAREGPLAVGTPFDVADWETVTATQALLVLKEPSHAV